MEKVREGVMEKVREGVREGVMEKVMGNFNIERTQRRNASVSPFFEARVTSDEKF